MAKYGKREKKMRRGEEGGVQIWNERWGGGRGEERGEKGVVVVAAKKCTQA